MASTPPTSKAGRRWLAGAISAAMLLPSMI
ncbi:KxYKxGKxW signal peptide domain-containing protein [Chromobacterium alkanivorans]|nr:KxYKxGKxW signal peptide domain-containing protein [Chromobacterium alkanivorans]